MAEMLPLFDDVYAVLFQYHMATERTVAMAIPSALRRDLGQRGMRIEFAPEKAEEAGTKRANAPEMAKAFPAEIAILSSAVGEGHLKDYIIVKVLS